MATAATKFLGALTPEQRQQATFAFANSEERLHWGFVPSEMFPRKGLLTRDMGFDRYPESFVPAKVSDWLGINEHVEQEIVKLNDRMEKTLPEIGTYIRDKYLKEE